jgi:ferric-dicitrate binding protein FerR (iron transport regulator)
MRGASGSTITTAAVMPGDVARALVWREGMIAFEASALGEAATEFARYSDKRIVIDRCKRGERDHYRIVFRIRSAQIREGRCE